MSPALADCHYTRPVVRGRGGGAKGSVKLMFTVAQVGYRERLAAIASVWCARAGIAGYPVKSSVALWFLDAATLPQHLEPEYL